MTPLQLTPMDEDYKSKKINIEFYINQMYAK